MDRQLVEQVVREVILVLESRGSAPPPPGNQREPPPHRMEPAGAWTLDQLAGRTSARIGVGRAGPRLKTPTLLKLRADHAMAKDAVLANVNSELIEGLGLFQVSTLCADKDEHLTRPDLGRRFSPETLERIRTNCIHGPQVQIYLSDGLSSRAVDDNAGDILPALTKGLEHQGIRVGTPFFVQYGRVPAMDVISETLDSEITCVLLGERPGLAAAGSMSAYIAYRAKVDMLESRRTVVSNIHRGGISAVEAGAYIADVIKTMLERKCSGVELKL